MATEHTSPITSQADSTRDVLDVLAHGIAGLARSKTETQSRRSDSVVAKPSRELLTKKMLADRWVCSVARLQRWRTVGEGPPYLKIVGKVLYRVKDIEAYEEASLVRKVF